MKVLVAHFSSECNEHISHKASLDEFMIKYDDECIEAMHIKDIFENNDIAIIPSIFANLAPNGMIQRSAYDFIKAKILDTIRANRDDIDGIYLQLHGASGICDLDEISGEHDLIKAIRAIVGKYMPIAVCMDPHGNITERYASQFNILRCYRESPHLDTVETQRIVAEKLVALMKNRRPMTPIVKKIPILVGGERSVSAYEPMKTINHLLDEAEKDERVFSASYHVGYIRHDDDKLGAAVVVIPSDETARAYCTGVAEQIAQYAWDHREAFAFSGNYSEPDEAVASAIAYKDKTVVITDSGDNCGAGGYGQNTIMLKEVLNHPSSKKILIAGINDAKTHASLIDKKVNDAVSINLGIGEDDNSSSVKVEGNIIAIGGQMVGLSRNQIVGTAYTIRIKDTNTDVIVLDHNIQYGSMEQFEAAGLHFHDYDIVIVKMGYLDTHLIPETTYHIMALTDGPTIQRSENIPFKLIARPMWPIDSFDELYYIDSK